MKKVFCFGEILLRMSPALNGAWINNASMPVYIGGAELNVANALAKWNVPVQYCSAAPYNYLTKEIIQQLQQHNIDTTPFMYAGNRIGIYMLPQGTDLKNAGVIYDRAYSSFSELKPGTINWHTLLKDASWFHFSAISPALNKDVAEVCKEALEAATQLGLTISIDLNYRAKLWQFGSAPKDIMQQLMQYCDVVMGNIWSANSLLGIPLNEPLLEQKNKDAYIEHANLSASQIMKDFPRCRTVANTFRFDFPGGIHYYATLNDKNGQHVSAAYNIDNVVDKVGSGDCFMAGLIYGYQNNYASDKIINYAAAAATGKIMEKGDATTQTTEAVLKRMQHD